MLQLQIGAESKIVDDELIRETADRGLMKTDEGALADSS